MSGKDSPQTERERPFVHSSPIDQWQPGQNLGCSDWLLVSQEMFTDFGNATGDPDPMHMDPEWAASTGPFATTIAFGFLTISLLTYFLREVISGAADGAGYPEAHHNHGFDRVRLVEPVPVGSRLRGHFIVREISEAAGRRLACLNCKIEIEGNVRPALVAEWLIMG